MLKNKTIMIALLVAAMICCLTLTASAASGELWADHVTATPGEEIYIDITLFNNPGVMVVDLTLTYDDALTLVNVKDGGTLGDYLHGNNTNANPYKLTWNNMADVTGNGVVASLTFKVSEAARPGDVLDIKIDVVDAYNYNDQDVDIVTVYGYVEVECAHKNITKTGEIPPKCNDVGYTESAYCNDCETYVSGHEEIPATGKHVSATGKYEKDAAEHYYVCGDCGEKFDNGAHNANTPTCTDKAICVDCGYEVGDIDPDNHENIELKDAKEAGCNSGGYSGDLYCSDCKTIFEPGHDTPPTGEHSGGIATCQAAAKCMYCGSEYGDKDPNEHEGSDGKWNHNEHGHFQLCICGEMYNDATHSGGTATCATKAKCAVCGVEYGDVDPSTHGETVTKNFVAASCVKDGYTGDIHCKDCDAKLETGETVKTSGAHGGGTATCVAQAKCDGCGREYGELDPNNHGDEIVKDAVEATCAKDGYTGDTYCKDCNKKLKSGETVKATGVHVDNDGKWEHDATSHYHTCGACETVFDKADHEGGKATCESGAICSVCQAEYGEKDPTNHDETETKDVKDATCIANGYSGNAYCVDCGTKVEEGSEIPATDVHVDEDGDGDCDHCDEKLESSSAAVVVISVVAVVAVVGGGGSFAFIILRRKGIIKF